MSLFYHYQFFTTLESLLAVRMKLCTIKFCVIRLTCLSFSHTHKVLVCLSLHILMDISSTPELRVVLWTAPRCLSSAFERSIRELNGVKVLYEPHQNPYYRGPERRLVDPSPESFVSTRPVLLDATFESADEKLLQPYPDHRAVFAKNHAYYVEGRYKKYIEGKFSVLQHTFLIRNPVKAIVSQQKAYKRTGFSFDPQCDCGFEQLHDLFKTVQLVQPNPVVIDADDLLADPKGIMQQYCSVTGLPFDEGMLTWTPGVVSDWTGFRFHDLWHNTAMMSSGFTKQLASDTENITDLPKDTKDAVEFARPFYEALYAARLKPNVN